eukprot:TRINITY_DN11409_c0_g1_i1.p2 TRINITY_DN11409_c0_g1~~TRINITY_DN11409_c0_g1_i1.p2  ORF type:complete len:179 (+),score=42.27 TRINITY_DN11409_c0_g1_i1:292-828(+)
MSSAHKHEERSMPFETYLASKSIEMELPPILEPNLSKLNVSEKKSPYLNRLNDMVMDQFLPRKASKPQPIADTAKKPRQILDRVVSLPDISMRGTDVRVKSLHTKSQHKKESLVSNHTKDIADFIQYRATEDKDFQALSNVGLRQKDVSILLKSKVYARYLIDNTGVILVYLQREDAT